VSAFHPLRTLGVLLRSVPVSDLDTGDMRLIWSALSISLIAPSPALAQAVPEGVHTDANGPSDICGIRGENALAIRAQLKADRNIVEKPSGSDRFETYFSSAETKQWTVTTKKDAAYPAVTCVYLYNSGGGTEMSRDMRCDASREACDALFQEFEANDAKIRAEIKGH
jgi:hypothetical protein